MGRGEATQGEGVGAVACMAETLRHGVGGHGASLDEEDRAGGKNGWREWQSGERGTAPFIPFKSGRYLPRHAEPLRV
jgi:hypothetical protein